MARQKRLKGLVLHPQTPLYSIDGKITFDGAVKKYWTELSKHWNAETQRVYRRHYSELLAPHFYGQPLCNFNDPSFFDNVIDEVRRATAANRRKSTEQAESQNDPMQHYAYILRRLFRITAEGEGFANPFVGTNFAVENVPTQEEIEAKIRTRLQKSFSPLQEWKLADELLNDPYCSGTLLGLTLCWAFGLRNGESCGLTWGDIHPMPGHPDLHILIVHTATIPGTRTARSKGKTPNFYRIWPIPQVIFEFLSKRKAHIEELIRMGKVEFSGKIHSVNDMPIACKGNEWTVRSTSDEISAIAQKVFLKIGLTEEDHAFYRRKPDESDPLGIIAWDDDLSAYTCRRNVATLLFILGFSLAQIQFLMGHNITDGNYSRHHFTNPDQLATLYALYKQRPIVNTINFDPPSIVITDSTIMRDVTDINILLSGSGKARVRIIPYLPNEKCTISLLNPNDTVVDACYQQCDSLAALPNTICMRHELHAAYRHAFMMHKGKFQSNFLREKTNIATSQASLINTEDTEG